MAALDSTELANADTIDAWLQSKGITPVAAAGVAGNAGQESGENPEEHAIDSNGYESFGLWEWNLAGAGAGLNPATYITGNEQQDMSNQLNLLWSQIQGDSWLPELQAAATPQQAADIFEEKFENAGIPALANREDYAEQIYTGGTAGAGGLPGPTAGGGPSGSSGGSGATPATSYSPASNIIGASCQYIDGFLNPDISVVPGWANAFTGVNQIVVTAVKYFDRVVGLGVGMAMVYLGVKIFTNQNGGGSSSGGSLAGQALKTTGEVLTVNKLAGVRQAETAERETRSARQYQVDSAKLAQQAYDNQKRTVQEPSPTEENVKATISAVGDAATPVTPKETANVGGQ